MLVLLTLIWGLTFPATRAALQQTDPIQFLALRFLFGLLLMMPLARLLRRSTGASSDAPGRDILPVVEGGITGSVNPHLHPFWSKLRETHLRSLPLRGIIIGLFLTAGFLLQVLGLQSTTASRSGFFTGLLVVITPPLALLLRTSRSPLLSFVAVVPALFGIYLLADPQLGGLNRGDLLTIGCAFAFALQMVMLEALSKGEGESIELTLWQLAMIAGVASLLALLAGNPVRLTLVGWLGVGYTALFGSVVAVYLQTRYQPEVPAGHAALIFMLEPVFAAGFATLLLHEPWTLRTLAGAGFVLGAMAFASSTLLRRNSQPGPEL